MAVGTYIDIDGDPNRLSATGAILRGMGDSFQTKVRALLGDINGVEAERPWGNDQYGQAFATRYHEVPEGSDTPFNEGVKDGMNQAGERLSKVGGSVVLAMTEIQGVEVQNKTDISGTYSA